LTLNIAHIQPFNVKRHALSVVCMALSPSFCNFGERAPVLRQFLFQNAKRESAIALAFAAAHAGGKTVNVPNFKGG
jgi:hypothetical protein